MYHVILTCCWLFVSQDICFLHLMYKLSHGLFVYVFDSFPVTPQDYQPPGFKEAEGDTMEFEREPVKLTMGEVATPFHTLKMDMATERQRLEQVKG